MFSQDITFFADGGREMQVVAKALVGIEAISDLLFLVYEKYQTGFSIVQTEVNHHPALLYYSEKKLVSCQIFEFSEDAKITRINTVIDAEKLKYLNSLSVTLNNE